MALSFIVLVGVVSDGDYGDGDGYSVELKGWMLRLGSPASNVIVVWCA